MVWEKRKSQLAYKESDRIGMKLAKIRGIPESSYREFMNPSESSVNDPKLLLNVVEAAEKILEAMKRKAKIAISADPDTDGNASTGMMYNYLDEAGHENKYIVYAQRSEGHGVEFQLNMIQDDTDLLIILDSSTNSTEACKTLKEKGIDIVILDHHAVEEENPYALIVNPQQADCPYPNKKISGATVTYKTLQVLDERIGLGVEDYIDLCAIGMYADMMPVDVLENRYLIIQGMQNIKNIGILSILKVNNQGNKKITSSTLGFTIAPSFNGTCRLDKIEVALQLLIEKDPEKSLALAKQVKKLNDERKTTMTETTERYISKGINTDNKIIVVTDTEASKGYNGLIATQLTNRYNRPAIVMRENSIGTFAGSYRTYGDMDMLKFLKKYKFKHNLLTYALGHPEAGGIAFPSKNHLDQFVDMVNEELADVEFDDSVRYDLEIEADDLTTKFIREVEEFNYLTDNRSFHTAKFLVRGLLAFERSVLGKERQDTVKIGCDNNIALMKFRTNDQWGLDIVDESKFINEVDVIGELNVNEFYRRNKGLEITNQIFVEDYQKL